MRFKRLTAHHQAVFAQYGLSKINQINCSCNIFNPGEIVINEGDAFTSFWLVVKGRAKAFRLGNNGKTLIMSRYISSGVIGDIELMSNLPQAKTTISAISQLECIQLPYSLCQKELTHNIIFSNKLGNGLALKLASSADSYVSSALYTGKQRLCAYILDNSNAGVFSGVLTEVSASIGMSYRHMFRLLDELCNQHILRKEERGFIILNKSALEHALHG
ncbi:Crp/Fnr family transcriptional regulator [Atopobium fossor]|uniref:Crp/Fnr family transcriptional regulator n=1 Tax=Atopobium fossor TaxID=39487 RepID=UPI000429804D|nr:cyclic nucleotide-binding domain-containing protein [Atopobium fossor]